jgi:hypothetical protein
MLTIQLSGILSGWPVDICGTMNEITAIKNFRSRNNNRKHSTWEWAGALSFGRILVRKRSFQRLEALVTFPQHWGNLNLVHRPLFERPHLLENKPHSWMMK